MKIVVRDSNQSTLGSLNINIRELGSELEKITVKVLSAASKPKSIRRIHVISDPDSTETKKIKNTEDTKTAPKKTSASTMEIKITIPSLPFAKIKKIAETLGIPELYKGLKNLITSVNSRIVKPTYMRFAKLPTKVRLASTIGLVLLVFIGGYNLLNTKSEVKTPAAKRQSLVRGIPDYQTVLPAGKTIQDLGGWVRVSPPNRNPVYAYTDKIGKVRVDVSEQPLPPTLQNDTSTAIARLADSLKASSTLTAGETTVYLGASPKGSQSLMLSKNNLLILIKSASPLTDKKWITYIDSLR